ncbi:MAG: Gfo/Idh/MocA family oxidoreductase [Planctomycetota bacterium]|nr:Gfo/Idh/MocA family oxidoreductase [Planctomycetota bacterium]
MQRPRSPSRRTFLGTSTAAGIIPFFAWTQPTFANQAASDRPLIGCIGLGGMGMGDARGHAGFGDIVAVCDVDLRHAERARHDEKVGKGKADIYRDYRQLLERSDIDVVSIVTPDHWHVKIAIEALEAGKHVFCQKPLTLTIEENKLIRAACKKHPSLQFFIGTQQRSDRSRFLRAVNMVHKGLLGPIKKVTVGINGSPKGGPFPVAEVPKELDWDMWLGQSPLVDYRKERCHGNFRWWYEYSGGKFTDWGAHHVDIAQWALREDEQGKGPVSIDGTDATHPVPFKNGFPEQADAYNTSTDFAIQCRYPNGVEMTVTSRGDNGITFEGEKGKIFVNRGKITGTPIEENWDKDHFTEDDIVALYKGKPFEAHKSNFFRCIREGGLPVSDVFSHLITMNTCHLTAIAARLGRAITWDSQAEVVIRDEQAQKMTARTPRSGYEMPRV